MTVRLAPIWVIVRCGTCHRDYVVNARSAPKIGRKTYCRKCWDRAMNLRATLGWTVYDCPEGTWPDLSSDDPTQRGTDAVRMRPGVKLL